jgi:hypothetical protein
MPDLRCPQIAGFQLSTEVSMLADQDRRCKICGRSSSLNIDHDHDRRNSRLALHVM